MHDGTERLEGPATGTDSQTATEGDDHAIPRRESLRRDRGFRLAPARRLTGASVGANIGIDDKSLSRESFRQFQSMSARRPQRRKRPPTSTMPEHTQTVGLTKLEPSTGWSVLVGLPLRVEELSKQESSGRSPLSDGGEET
jgi:hypothetical protein